MREFCLRWIGTVLAALIGWLVAIWIGHSILFIGLWLCPAEYFKSNQCSAPWMDSLFQCTLFIGSAVAAGLFVLLPAVVAPSRKPTVAIVAFLAGAMIAVRLVFEIQAWGPFLLALGTGLLTVWFVFKRGKTEGHESMPV
jgi:hypothetical protein